MTRWTENGVEHQDDHRDEDLVIAAAPISAKRALDAGMGRSAKIDLLSLLEVLEDAIRQGALMPIAQDDELYPREEVKAANRAISRLVDSYHVLRRWWP